jgi:probable HAF family extracellular repeat protein
MTSLGTLGGNYSEAYEINDADQIVGESKTAGGQFHAFLYSGGSMIDLGTFGGTRSKAFGINEAGQVVGGARDAGENDRAFFYDTGTMYDLNTLAAGYMGGGRLHLAALRLWHQ